jgi:hypothetical protein
MYMLTEGKTILRWKLPVILVEKQMVGKLLDVADCAKGVACGHCLQRSRCGSPAHVLGISR